ncbi:MAG: DUF1638 domain-containing protein [Magnetococcales bacterium]|nr:DUF1638 domain-containing protein [Magnetococcales bacterium]
MNAAEVTTKPIPLIGCAILAREINYLIEKNRWPVAAEYLASELHNRPRHLEGVLRRQLVTQELLGKECLVVYGSCHPRMQQLLDDHQAIRTPSQNCISMLLGQERFMQELEQGSYFLLEEWSQQWQTLFAQLFGHRQSVVQEIFRCCHQRMVALHTPCSDDFMATAREAADYVGLPLLRMDSTLDHLELLLAHTLRNRQQRSE